MMTQQTMSLKKLWLMSLLYLLLPACSTDRGRIMTDTEQDYVDTDGAGAATYDRLIEGAVNKLLNRHRDDFENRKVRKVAFISVENHSAEELGEWGEQIYEVIDTKINHFEGYQTISRRYVDAGLREGRLKPDDLFVPKKRRQFLAIMEQQNNPAECLLYASITRGVTDGQDVRQHNYRLTMELVDVASGNNYKETQLVRKAFTD